MRIWIGAVLLIATVACVRTWPGGFTSGTLGWGALEKPTRDVTTSTTQAAEPTHVPAPLQTFALQTNPSAGGVTTVMVVINGVSAEAAAARIADTTRPLPELVPPTPTPILIPTAVPTATPFPTWTPQPTSTPKGQTFPPLLPPDLATRDGLRFLPVPYRSQLDGNPYEEADCGPASMAMILAAYGKDVKTMEIRNLVNTLQGTHGYTDAGTFIENFGVVAQRYGLKPSGLWANGSVHGRAARPEDFRRWSIAELRRTLDAGHPVIPQVWYRGLPGRDVKKYNGDHYIVITGYVGDTFIYNDPIDNDGPGYARRMTTAQMDRVWRNSDFPYAGIAIGGPPERPSLRK